MGLTLVKLQCVQEESDHNTKDLSGYIAVNVKKRGFGDEYSDTKELPVLSW